LWRRLTGVYEFDAREVTVVEAAARQADRVADLDALVERDGLMVPGSRGQLVMHPGVSEARLGRVALTRLLASLDLPADDDGEDEVGERRAMTGPKGRRSARAAHAATVRWNRHRAAQQARSEAEADARGSA
jgi:hypothetical protein